MADFCDTDPSPNDQESQKESIADHDGEPPEMQWDDSRLTLGDLTEEVLPSVCKFKGNKDASIPPGLNIYSEQPLLVYSRYKKRQVQTRTIFKDPDGQYYEVGQTLLIPDDFDGRFELVPPDFSRTVYYRHISDIAKIMPKRIFTRTDITAIRAVEKDDGNDPEYVQRKIKAGSILRVTSTFAAKWRTSAVKKSLMKKKSQKQEWTTYEMNYLKVIDKDDKEVLVPYTCRGRFNVIYDKGVNDSKAIYRIKDILAEFPLPVKVRLVFGKAPVVPCIFTGMMVLKAVSSEESVVCSTIMNRRNVLLELPVSLRCTVYKAENEASYTNRKTYKDARSLCHKYANSYAALIKLSPEMDTDQQMMLHIPTARSSKADDNLHTISAMTNMSLTDDEPVDSFMESATSSDTDSLQSADANFIPIGNMIELREIQEINC